MLSEFDLLLDVTRRSENAGLDYMLTGSMALNHYAQPRMTRDIDIVRALSLKDLDLLPEIFDEDFCYIPKPPAKPFSVSPYSTLSTTKP